MYKKEKDELEHVETITIVDYIKSDIELIMALKLKESCSSQVSIESGESYTKPPKCMKNYEEIIQKLEEEARNAARREYQLKLYIESLKSKLESLTTSFDERDRKIKELEEVIFFRA